MIDKLISNLQKVCQLLEKHQVEYLIVGGTAVALHGYFRMSLSDSGELTDKPDLDFWYNPTYNNYFKLLNVLEDLGVDVQRFRDEKTPNPQSSFFKKTFDEFSLDFLPAIRAALKFGESYKKREVVDLNGINVSFISYADLIADKKATSRPKDLNDIEQLNNNAEGAS